MIGQQQVGIADDGGQHVVEVVRDPAGELADRLHLLTLREVLLQRALLGRVEGEDGRARALVACRIGRRRRKAGLTALAPAPSSETSSGAISAWPFAAASSAARSAAWSRSATSLKMDGRPSCPCAFSASGARRAKAAFGRRSAPDASTAAMATGVELKIRAKRTSAARRSSAPFVSPGARLMTIERDGPGDSVAGESHLMEDAGRDEPAVPGLEVDVELVGRHIRLADRTSSTASAPPSPAMMSSIFS